MLLDELKKQMFAAMKANAKVEKEILRVAIGELETVASRSTTPLSEEESLVVLKKLVKSNEECALASPDAENNAILAREVEILRAFLPTTLSVEQILSSLVPVIEAIRAATGDGPAVGIAMKHLKSTDARAEGKDVTAAVKQLRQQS